VINICGHDNYSSRSRLRWARGLIQTVKWPYNRWS